MLDQLKYSFVKELGLKTDETLQLLLHYFENLIVTGATDGIGRGFCQQLGKQGMNVILGMVITCFCTRTIHTYLREACQKKLDIL